MFIQKLKYINEENYKKYLNKVIPDNDVIMIHDSLLSHPDT